MELNKSIGVIDIGSNSFHLLVGGYHDRDYFKIIDDLKVNVRLCEGIAETGYMREDRMECGIQTLSMFRYLCESYKLDTIITVATAAVRKAANGPDFVERAKREAGIDIEVISGAREAELDYLGCINSLAVRDALMLDVGGGSAEFVLIKDRQMVDALSLPFGSIDLMEMFDLSNHVTTHKIDKLKKFLNENFEAIAFLKQAEGLPVIGVGGTIRNIGRIHRRMTDYPMELAHNYEMTQDEVQMVVEHAAAMDLEERKKLDGLSSGRTDIFIGAAYTCAYLMKTIGSETLIISDCGIRNGLIYNYFGFGPGCLIADVFENSLINTMLNYDVNIGHSWHLLGIVSRLNEEMAPYSCYEHNVDKILTAASMLHDTGIMIQYRNHHEHSFYLILNSGLEGISQKELLLTAFVALNHRTNKKIQISKPYQVLLNDEDKAVIDTLSLYLQIGEYLDRTMDGVVRDLKVEIKGDTAVLHIVTIGHAVMSGLVVDSCGKKFKRVFGKNLKVEAEVYPQAVADKIPDMLKQPMALDSSAIC